MISVYKIKPYFQKALTPILRMLHSLGITANQITIASVILSVVVSFCFWYAAEFHFLFLALPIGLLIRMALNALDGMMARIYNQTSATGEMLNEIGDVFSDFIIFIPLLKYQSDNILLVVLFIGLSIINEFTGVMGKVIGSKRLYDGPMGKSDRALLIGVYGLLLFCNVHLSTLASTIIFSVINILLVCSTAIRFRKALKLL